MFDMKKAKKENPPKRTYKEVMEDFQKAQTPKEYRTIHKEMKRDYKESVPIWYRYPNAPIYVSVFALIMVVIIKLFKN